MRQKLGIVIFFIFMGSFVCTLIQTSSLAFSDLNEENMEEIVDLTEKELEKEFQISFTSAEVHKHSFLLSSLDRFQCYFVTHLIKDYNEPNPVSLFTPPDFMI